MFLLFTHWMGREPANGHAIAYQFSWLILSLLVGANAFLVRTPLNHLLADIHIHRFCAAQNTKVLLSCAKIEVHKYRFHVFYH